MSIDLEFIREFLHTPGVEGPQMRKGYVPCRQKNYTGIGDPAGLTPVGMSGVTIGTGCDLGQWTELDLEQAGVEAALINRFRPYLGLNRRNALNALYAAPLALSPEEADLLDQAVIRAYAKRVEQRYDSTGPALPFAELPKEAQTCIFSLLYQLGCQSYPRYPNTWKALVRGDWKDARQRLCTPEFWNRYQNRRGIEGRLLLALER